ncbi:hypothetical protein PsYK624_107410 [Phanerochaete sordida]|uniref:Uncharacterized protein n=1 Tax=Phanerochaete sordida TaxID=48140 RepID=A0A9P3LGH5_9APHY|nr:hypothetical protein PsYK624_107410 [Phanerochaete sordida]
MHASAQLLRSASFAHCRCHTARKGTLVVRAHARKHCRNAGPRTASHAGQSRRTANSARTQEDAPTSPGLLCAVCCNGPRVASWFSHRPIAA